MQHSLNVMRHGTGSQCNSSKLAVTWSLVLSSNARRAATFCTRCNRRLRQTGQHRVTVVNFWYDQRKDKADRHFSANTLADLAKAAQMIVARRGHFHFFMESWLSRWRLRLRTAVDGWMLDAPTRNEQSEVFSLANLDCVPNQITSVLLVFSCSWRDCHHKIMSSAQLDRRL